MRLKVIAVFLSLAVLSAFVQGHGRKPQNRQVAVGAIMAAAGKQVLAAAVSAVVKEVIGLFHDNTDDTVLFGRPIRLEKLGNNGIKAKDFGTGLSVTRYGQTEAIAMQAAMNDLFTMLFQMGYISVDDLHIPPKFTVTTPRPCGDNYPDMYCSSMANSGFCNRGSHFRKFMEDNCGDTCGYCDSQHHHISEVASNS